jgi:hypothetical protein
MTIQLELWHLVTLLLAFFGACGAFGKILLSQSQKHLSERFEAQDGIRKSDFDQLTKRLDSMEISSREEANQWQRMERELLQLKADLPLHYVRREDYIRGQSVIEAKLDGLAGKLENIQLRNLMKGSNNVD